METRKDLEHIVLAFLDHSDWTIIFLVKYYEIKMYGIVEDFAWSVSFDYRAKLELDELFPIVFFSCSFRCANFCYFGVAVR